MKLKNIALALLASAILAYGAYTIAAPDVTVLSIQGTPGVTFATSTSANTTVAVPDNDITIASTGYLADGSTASTSTDYSIIMPAIDSAGSASTMHDRTSYGSGVQANQFIVLPQGASFTIRGYDFPFVTADSSKEFIIRSYGHTAQITIVKGSGLGHNP